MSATTEALWTGPEHDPHRYRVDLVDGEPAMAHGGGGDGFVFRAWTRHRSADSTERPVALKLMTTVRPVEVAGLLPTAAALANLRHRHLIAQLETFVGPALTCDPRGHEGDRVVWSAAEWIDGVTLRHARDLAATDRLRLVAQVATAVQHLHGASVHPAAGTGLVHGDVKPGNVLVDRRGDAVLIDVGSVRLLGDSGARLGGAPRSGGWGTPGWLAPEVLVGSTPGAAADCWGVGALGHFVLTGVAPGHDGAACARERLLLAAGREGLHRPESVARHLALLLDTEPHRRPTDLDRWAERLTRMVDGRSGLRLRSVGTGGGRRRAERRSGRSCAA